MDRATTGSTGQRLRAWRTAHHLSQAELASELGVQRNTLTRWENGRRQIQHLKMLRLALTELHRRLTPVVPEL